MSKEENEGCTLPWMIGGGVVVMLIWVLLRMAEGRTFMEGLGDQLTAIGILILLIGGGLVAMKIMIYLDNK